MNIFRLYSKKIRDNITALDNDGVIKTPKDLSSINVDVPPENIQSDISTNAAMVLSKINSKSPLVVAEIIKKKLLEDNDISNIDILKPGFINIKFKSSFWNLFLENIINNPNEFGVDSSQTKKNFLIEFVSANPTGPLHVGHCRGAILGDVVSNILKFNKHNVFKEYYVNDYGNQIISFTKSVFFRCREIVLKETFPNDENLYPGEYIIQIAQNIIKNNPKIKFDNFDNISNQLTVLAVSESLILIKENLKSLGIKHDNFQSETEIVKNNEVQKVVEKLQKNNFIYKGRIKAPESEKSDNWVEREQLLFKSTDFGDDKDRALQKSDNSWTYFASDVAYHNHKIERQFDTLINILGADHAGYIKRITASVDALTGEQGKLICKVSQLVKLIKDGKLFKMSKRKGDYITVEDLISEVGKDATRFIMLSRTSDVELDFDFTKVKEKSKDNPLYYVQYCYARISSVFRNINKKINDEIDVEKYDFNYSEDEIKILKKISQWPLVIEIASKKLEPHRIPNYLYELSSDFHSYWNMGKDNEDKRFINKDKKISNDKLVFLKSISNVVKSGMNIIGVDTPESM
ncbi:MAG: arginine--tRNA ligase [Candidatus Pelagibacterales bacterium]|nr:MAG: arginine--tRNA ligase [Pelagibacterales bacterium]|tara:strand:+ start:2370 stop:4097 length:1728 start_codon:yes stop_codon:yes gene_type:complete